MSKKPEKVELPVELKEDTDRDLTVGDLVDMLNSLNRETRIVFGTDYSEPVNTEEVTNLSAFLKIMYLLRKDYFKEQAAISNERILIIDIANIDYVS